MCAVKIFRKYTFLHSNEITVTMCPNIEKIENITNHIVITPEMIITKDGKFYDVLYSNILFSIDAGYYYDSHGGAHSFYSDTYLLISKTEEYVDVHGKKVTREDL